MPFDLLSLPQDVRNHILVCVAQLPIANLARASRVNRELNKQWKENPLLLKALLRCFSRLQMKRPSVRAEMRRAARLSTGDARGARRIEGREEEERICVDDSRQRSCYCRS